MKMDDEIKKAVDISNLSDKQIEELYNDVLEWGTGSSDGSLLSITYCYMSCSQTYVGGTSSTSCYYVCPK